MAKTPGKRHSGPKKEPVVIDLDRDDVKHIDETAESTDGTPESDLAAKDYGAGEKGEKPDEGTDSAPDQASPGEAETAGAWQEEELAREEARAEESESEAELAAKDYGAGDDNDQGEEPAAARADEMAGHAPGRPAQRSAVLPAVGGGIVGALVALTLAGGASYLGLLPSGGGNANTEIAQVRAELLAMNDRLAADEAASREEIPPGVSRALDEARGGIDSLTRSIGSLQGEVDDLKQALSAGVTAAGGDALSEGALARLEALENRLGELAGTVEAANQLARDAAGKAEQAAGDAAKAADAANEAGAEAASIGSRLDTLASDVAALAGKVSEGSGQSEVARAIAATALKSAIDRGSPFMGELETFASVAGTSPAIEALRALAAGGVPTRGEISEEAAAAAYAMIGAAEAPPADASLLDRLASSARSLVKVRPTGDVEGESAAAIAARMESAVQRGDYAKALEEYETLPEASKQAGAAFAARIKARMEADRLVDDVLSSALRTQE